MIPLLFHSVLVFFHEELAAGIAAREADIGRCGELKGYLSRDWNAGSVDVQQGATVSLTTHCPAVIA